MIERKPYTLRLDPELVEAWLGIQRERNEFSAQVHLQAALGHLLSTDLMQERTSRKLSEYLASHAPTHDEPAVCAWCHPGSAGDGHGSHGICAGHQAEMLANP